VHSKLREWAGATATEGFDERLALRAELDRLQDLIIDTARWLKDAGHPQKAALVLRAVTRSERPTALADS
jgi:hypothetical protein